MLTLSERVRKTPPSPIRKLAPLAAGARARGLTVYPLNIGQPDIPTPKEFLDGLAHYTENVVAYEQSQGSERLIAAWCDFTKRSLGISVDPRNFLVTTGASEALIFLFMACCDPGDEVIIFDPTYANYMGFSSVTGVNLVPIRTRIEDNFALPEAKLIRSAITSRTKAILLCNPNNPTGTVYSEQEILSLLEICRAHEIFLVADETYREFVFDDLVPLSLLQMAANDPHAVVIDSLSKRFSLCGARLGCLLSANLELMRGCLNVAQARLASPTIEQFAAAYMLERLDGSYITNTRTEYQRRRDAMYSALAQIPGVLVHKPQGAFYCLAKLPLDNCEEFASFMLSNFSDNGATTFVAPAAGFYMTNGQGNDKIRVASVLKCEDLTIAVDLLARGLVAFKQR